MKNTNPIEETNPRRDFIKLGSLAAAATACGSLICGCNKSEVEGGRKVKLLSPEGEIIEVNESELREPAHICIPGKDSRKGIPDRKFVMVVDLAKCKNARKCMEACDKKSPYRR